MLHLVLAVTSGWVSNHVRYSTANEVTEITHLSVLLHLSPSDILNSFGVYST
jgi:hypothetical protein